MSGGEAVVASQVSLGIDMLFGIREHIRRGLKWELEALDDGELDSVTKNIEPGDKI